MQLPEVTDAQCAAVTAAFRKNPDAKSKLDAIRDRVRSGEIDRAAAREESQKLYESLKIDAMVARACQFRDARNAGGEQQGAPRSPAAGSTTQPSAASSTPSVGTQRDDPMAASGGAAAPARGRARAAMVFVGDSGKFEPRMIMAGVSNYDYTEVVSGAKEGEKVALLAAASMAAQRQQQTDRMRSMTGGAVPGMTQQAPAAGGRRP
jgi:HlyD family secretion protein